MFVRVFVAALGALHAIAIAQPLSFDDAPALALIHQPLITGQQAAIDASRQNAVAESELPDPRLKLGINNLPLNGADQYSVTRDFMTMRSIAIEQMVPAGDKRRLKGARGRLEAELAAAELQNIKRTIQRDARLAWLAVYYPVKAAEFMEAALVFYDQQRNAAEIALRGGRATLAEIARIGVEIELQHDRLLDNAGQQRKGRAELARWIGPAAERELGAMPAARDALPPLSALRERIHDHAQLVAARAEIALAQNDVQQAQAAYKTDWSVEVMYSKRGPAYSDMVSVQVGVELPLFTANRQDRRLGAKLSRKEQHEQQHENHRRMLVAELESAYASWQALTQRTARFEQEVLPQAARRVEAALAGYRAGRADLASAIEARRGRLELELQHLALQVELARARTQLEYLAAYDRGAA